MPKYRFFLIGILFLFLVNSLTAKVIQTPIFSWVKPLTFNSKETIPVDQIKDGCFYILSDKQYNLKTNQFYAHYAYKLVSELGVENNSEIQLNYNPAYQKFYLHSLKILRDGKTIDCRKTAKIKDIQREEELEWHIYDETRTVYIILSDVRPGDIIEYEFSVEGFNPIFNNKFQTSFSYNFDSPLLNFYFRVIKGHAPLYIKYFNSSFKPVFKTTSLGEEWVWESKKSESIDFEKNAPSWFNQYPTVEMSDYKSWDEVENWGIHIFKNNEPLNTQLLGEIDRIRNKFSSKADRAMAAVRFVQRQIRYLGIEIGVNSHKPTSPNRVYLQRYGDCKDKTLLLCKILNKLDIEAYPVLISTTLTKVSPEHLPSPNIFNHVVVKTIIDNKEYWFDPTISHQEGNLTNYYFPDYRFGLVLDGKNNRLDSIPLHMISKTEVQEDINIEDMIGNATLKVKTTYSGYDADEMRYSIAENGIKGIQKIFLTFYKTIYDSINAAQTIVYTDDSAKNKIIVTEYYRIKDFWDSDSTVKRTNVYSYQISEKLKIYKSLDSKRKAPVSLEYPLNITHKYVIKFPEEWTIDPIHRIIKNKFFSFESNSTYANKTCYIDYSFQTYTDFIPVNKIKEFNENIKVIQNDYNGMEFTYNASKSKGATDSSWNTLYIILFLFFIVVFIRIGRRTFLLKSGYSMGNKMVQPTANRIGGWMVLPIIGLVFTPIMAVYELISANLFSVSLWQLYSADPSGYGGLFLFMVFILQFAFIVVPVLLLISIFKYDRRVPNYMIYYFTVNLVVNLILYILSNKINLPQVGTTNEYLSTLIRAMVVCAVWVPYFHHSLRVKGTFVR